MKMSDAENKTTLSKGGTKHKRARRCTGVLRGHQTTYLSIYLYTYLTV